LGLPAGTTLAQIVRLAAERDRWRGCSGQSQREFAMHYLSRRNAIRGLALVVAAQTFATASRSVAAEKAPLAIKGYDPVAYFIIGSPTRGLPEIEYQWDDQSFRFSRAEHRDIFKADPVRYAPQFANFCAMALTRGELHEADPENWLISEGKLYIFGMPIGRDLFQQGLSENIVRANQNRALIQKR
jgi:hypothetical protein